MLLAMRASTMCKAVAGCDSNEVKQAAAAEAVPGLFVTDEYREMLDRTDVDIVAIYTPDKFHVDHIEMAFDAGKHVLCTKPLVNDVAHAAPLRAAAERTGKRLQVAQSTRFYEPFQRQRELYEAGAVGAVEVVDAHYNHRMDWYYEKSPWTTTDTHWAYLGLSHPVDLLRWYLGSIRSIQAVGTTTALGTRYGLKTPDAISVNAVAENGRIGRAFGNYGFHELPKGRSLIECFLMGDAGSSLARYPELRFSRTDDRGVDIDEDFDASMAGYYYRHELKGMHYGEFCNVADYFASKIFSGEPNSPDLEEGLATVATMAAVVEALETGAMALVKSV